MTRSIAPSAPVTRADRPRVLLVSMPFASFQIPNLSLGILQAELRAAGIDCDVRHFNLDIVRFLDERFADWVSYFGPMIGEWLMVPALYGAPLHDDEMERFGEIVQRLAGRFWGPELERMLIDGRASCEAFVDWAADQIDVDRYDVIGLTTMFQQSLASLALATRLKRRAPRLPIILGGANAHDDMGHALHECFPVLDIVATGEADLVVASIVRAALGETDPATVRGIVYRDGEGRSVSTGPAPLVEDLDTIPPPDFDDWIADRAAAGLDGGPWRLLMETSRGCWWGERSHCTFCGLNGNGMAFRSKSADRALGEMRDLRARYGCGHIETVDNIIDMRYFRTLLPRLAEEVPKFRLFYEIKASVSHDQVRLLAAAGVTEMLPGIEHFSDRVLDLMGKGTTGLQNIQLLKWAAEFGIRLEWNFLYGFPGERRSDYEAIRPIIEAIRFLEPPKIVQRALVHRFSPFHREPERLGFTNVRAADVYPLLYPFDPPMLDRLAYMFEADYIDAMDPHLAHEAIADLAQGWIDRPETGGLWMQARSSDIVDLVDTRSHRGEPRTLTIRDWRAVTYLACDRARTIEELRAVDELAGLPAESLRQFLDWCVAQQLMVHDRGRYLALAVHAPPRWEPDHPGCTYNKRVAVRIPVTST